MPGPIVGSNFTVIIGTLGGVADHQRNRSPGGSSFEYAGEDFNGVLLPAGGGKPGLPRFSAVQISLNIGFCERKSGRAAVDNDADALAVGFAPGSD